MIRFMLRGPSSSGEGDKSTSGTIVDDSRQLEAYEEFQRTILKDSQEVAMKAVSSCNNQIRHILAEVVQQSGSFWSTQLSKASASHQAALAELQAQMTAAHRAAEDTRKQQEQVVSELRSQLDDVQDALAQTQVGHVREMAMLQERVHSAETTLEEATRTYKGLLQDLHKQVREAHEAANEADLRAQQKKMVMLQTSEAQRKEIEELKAVLGQEKAHSAALDERSKKLTALAQHLLAKQSKSAAAALPASLASSAVSVQQPSVVADSSIPSDEESVSIRATDGNTTQGGAAPSSSTAGQGDSHADDSGVMSVSMPRGTPRRLDTREMLDALQQGDAVTASVKTRPGSHPSSGPAQGVE